MLFSYFPIMSMLSQSGLTVITLFSQPQSPSYWWFLTDTGKALAWTFTIAAIVLTAGRYAIRGWMLRKLDWDDATHLLALVVLVAYVATYTAMFPINYAVEDWVTGNGDMPSVAVLELYLHYEMAVWLLFWVIIYLVKFSFLLFYRSIFGVSRIFKKAWWAVTVFTFLTFWACFFAMLWSCNTPSQLFIVGE